MGMFDYITNVPESHRSCDCGAKLDEWQSKDWDCQLERIPYWYVSNFYTSCDNCNMWHKYNLSHRPRPFIPIQKYKKVM